MSARNPGRKTKWLDCYMPHRLEMLVSPAWRAAPVPLRRVLERIEIEHLRHGGQENGNLFVPYKQFVDYGISKRQIHAVADLGQALGLLEVIQDCKILDGPIRPPNAYRLTYVPKKGVKAPTDEWRSVTEEQATALIAKFREKEKRSRGNVETIAQQPNSAAG